jgi:hypothetical protein
MYNLILSSLNISFIFGAWSRLKKAKILLFIVIAIKEVQKLSSYLLIHHLENLPNFQPFSNRKRKFLLIIPSTFFHT